MSEILFVEYELNSELDCAYNLYGDASKLEELAIQNQNKYSGLIFCGCYEDESVFGFSLSSKDEQMEYEKLKPQWPYDINDESVKENYGFRLFRTLSHSPLDLVRVFRVGTHDAGVSDAQAIENVLVPMSKIYQEFPFWPYSINQAGYKCRFGQPISKTSARKISEYIGETGGWELMMNANTDPEFDDDPVAGSLYEFQEISLWWD